MRRTGSELVAHVRISLTLLVGAVVAVIVPSSLTDSASTVVITSLALAVAAVVGVGACAAVVPSPATAGSLAKSVEVPLHRPARVTDPVHHPIRPRAPGI